MVSSYLFSFLGSRSNDLRVYKDESTMGRWAFFNTGVEYKFAFATQPSGDILKFSGQDITEEDGEYRHMWVRKFDLEAVRALLQMSSEMCVEPKWESYEQTKEGTHSLLADLHATLLSGSPDESVFRYILGCLIYHQLLYTPVLVANYEG